MSVCLLVFTIIILSEAVPGRAHFISVSMFSEYVNLLKTHVLIMYISEHVF